MIMSDISKSDLAKLRGADVQATDGRVGTVDDLITDPKSGELSHLVLLEGHLWGKKEVTLPLSAIDRVEANTVHLKLDKAAVEQLPAIPYKRPRDEGDITKIELLARIFDTPDGAERALDGLEEWHRLHAIRIRDAALLVKDEAGEASLKDLKDLSPGKGGLIGAVAGGLLGLVGGPVGVVVGALAGAGAGGLTSKLTDLGFPDEFLARFQDHLQPGTSALVMVVEHESRRTYTEAYADLPGIVLHQTLTDKMVEQLVAESEA
jgi:uncharacterized membrane protein/sporulation protein YlmC with PRC-barrel domain